MHDYRPKRYVFNRNLLLRRPDVLGPIFNEDHEGIGVDRIVELTFSDYTMGELGLMGRYNEVLIHCFVDQGTNDWQTEFIARLTNLRLIDTKSFVVDEITHITGYFYYDDIYRQWYAEDGEPRWDAWSPQGATLNRLLWRLPDFRYVNVRHWHRAHSLQEDQKKHDWTKNGF